MSTIKIRNENGEFVDIPVIQGQKGEDGQSVSCVKVADEETAIEQSILNPNNIYYW